MRRIERAGLEQSVVAYLGEKTAEVASNNDPKGFAKTQWENKLTSHFLKVRSVLRSMAGGRERCMYCGDSAGTDIDHFRPKKDFPLMVFVWENYLLACSHCNSNRKRDLFPLDDLGSPLLLDPTADSPQDHLSLSPSLGEITARTQRGITTIETMGLNRAHLVQGRIDAWLASEALIREYGKAVARGAEERMGSIRRALRSGVFPEVMDEIIRAADSGFGLAEDISDLLREHRELRS